MCITFNKVSPVQLIYHESRFTDVKAIDFTHPTDMNIHLNYSAVMNVKIISSSRSQTTTRLLQKYIVYLLNSLYNFLLY